jgi:hypothetical protein
VRRRRDLQLHHVVGAWMDVGDGACQRCSMERRLYTPLARIDIRVCSACSQVYSKVVLDNRERDAA